MSIKVKTKFGRRSFIKRSAVAAGGLPLDFHGCTHVTIL